MTLKQNLNKRIRFKLLFSHALFRLIELASLVLVLSLDVNILSDVEDVDNVIISKPKTLKTREKPSPSSTKAKIVENSTAKHNNELLDENALSLSVSLSDDDECMIHDDDLMADDFDEKKNPDGLSKSMNISYESDYDYDTYDGDFD